MLEIEQFKIEEKYNFEIAMRVTPFPIALKYINEILIKVKKTYSELVKLYSTQILVLIDQSSLIIIEKFLLKKNTDLNWEHMMGKLI